MVPSYLILAFIYDRRFRELRTLCTLCTCSNSQITETLILGYAFTHQRHRTWSHCHMLSAPSQAEQGIDTTNGYLLGQSTYASYNYGLRLDYPRAQNRLSLKER